MFFIHHTDNLRCGSPRIIKVVLHTIEYQCRFCGFTSNDPEEFDFDQCKQGFWCNCCDGYTYLKPSSEDHRFTLILEDKTAKNSLKPNKPNIKLNKQLSPLRYPGGKSKLIDYIYTQIIKKHAKTLVEPFAGGGSVGLSLLEARAIDNLILNDLDVGIYALFTIIKNDPDSLIQKIRGPEPTRADFYTAQKLIKADYPNSSLLESAWALLIVNRLAYSGIVNANPLGGKNGSSVDLLSRWRPENLCKRIKKINQMAKRITVLKMDACEVIEEMYWHPATTILIDPPYYKQGKNLYHCYLDEDEHVKLNVLLDNLYQGCPGADIILYYDNDEFIEQLYLYPNIEKINRAYAI